ncbi:AAA family ATPase peroxin 6 [Saccharomycopsis crataegensis]|uniref:Peroxisomal ATPase PEX6 n=1 Tax=Saccharomycopsis crataegensis TaxID=43959 RepID=A0AAV5QJR8_9ASCO|nr:AAA family ATPase peroxin 6 [Saccharomycopsis crataegensis]
MSSNRVPMRQPVIVDTIFDYKNSSQKGLVNISKDAYEALSTTDIEDKSINERYIAAKLLGSTAVEGFRIYKVDKVIEGIGNSTIILPADEIFHSRDQKGSHNITISKALLYDIQVIEIEHIVVSISDENAYSFLKSKGDDYSALFGTDTGSNRLIHQHDLIQLSKYHKKVSGKVLFVEPLSQGILTKNSKITLVFDKNQEIEKPVSQVAEIAKKGQDKMNLLDELNRNALSIDEYLSKTLALEEKLDLSSRKEEVKDLILTAQPMTFKHTHFTPIPNPKEDPEIFAFTKFDNLVKLNYFSGDYAKLKINCQDGKQIERKVKLFALVEPNNFDNESLYISPILYMNLGSPQSINLFNKLCGVKVSNDVEREFKLARQVTIARIASPVSLNRTYQQTFLLNLKDYFESSLRIINKNSIIAIPIDTLLAKSLFSAYGSSNYPSVIPKGTPNEIVWFMITEIISEDDSVASSQEQYLLNHAKTRMVQLGVIKDFKIPKISNESMNYYKYLSMKPFFKFSEVIEKKRDEERDGNLKLFSFAEKLKNLISTSLLNNFDGSLQMNTCVLLHSLTRNVGKSTIVKNLSLELGINFIELDGYDLVQAPGFDLKVIGTIYGKLESTIKNCKSPIIVYFKHLDALAGSRGNDGGDDGSGGNAGGGSKKNNFNVKLVEMMNDFFVNNSKVMFVASTNELDKISNDLRNIFSYNIEVTVPSEIERQEIFKFLLENSNRKATSCNDIISSLRNKNFDYRIGDQISLKDLSLQSAGLNPIDLAAIVKNAKNIALDRLYTFNSSQDSKTNIMDLVLGNQGCITLKPEDFETAINSARNTFSESIGAPKIPNVKWEDVGGLDLVKDEILDTIEMPLKNPYLFNNGLKKRSGILFYGPPGTGKTLLAKAIATNFSLNFFSVKGPELLNMYIGESEANVRKVFQKARDAKPCVVFFDELDSVAPKRGNQGDSGGVMDRIVSQLLSELDGMSDGDDGDGVFVVGATNRPDLLDEALLRPGRFDKMLYLGIADTHEKQLNILKALTRKFMLDKDVDLEKLVEGLQFNYTGADFYALSSDSMLNAMTRKAKETDIKVDNYNASLPKNQKKINTRWWFDNVATEEDIKVTVKQEDFAKAAAQFIPSVSAEELQHYLRVRNNFEGGKTKAKGNVDGEASQNGHAYSRGDLKIDVKNKVNGFTSSDKNGGLYDGINLGLSSTTFSDDDDTDLYGDVAGSSDTSQEGDDKGKSNLS